MAKLLDWIRQAGLLAGLLGTVLREEFNSYLFINVYGYLLQLSNLILLAQGSRAAQLMGF